jgi:hypothetical protein
MASNDHANPHRAWTGVAEAEGFGPPGGHPPLAFKPRAATYRSSHGAHDCWSRLGTSATRTVVNRHE